MNWIAFLVYFFVQRLHKYISFAVNHVSIFHKRKLTAGHLKVLQTQTKEKKNCSRGLHYFSVYIMFHLTIKPARCSHGNVTYAVILRGLPCGFCWYYINKKSFLEGNVKVLSRYGHLAWQALILYIYFISHSFHCHKELKVS